MFCKYTKIPFYKTNQKIFGKVNFTLFVRTNFKFLNSRDWILCAGNSDNSNKLKFTSYKKYIRQCSNR